MDTPKSTILEMKFVKGESKGMITTSSEGVKVHLKIADEITKGVQSKISSWESLTVVGIQEGTFRAESRVWENPQITESSHSNTWTTQIVLSHQAPKIINNKCQWKEERLAPILAEIDIWDRLHWTKFMQIFTELWGRGTWEQTLIGDHLLRMDIEMLTLFLKD